MVERYQLELRDKQRRLEEVSRECSKCLEKERDLNKKISECHSRISRDKDGKDWSAKSSLSNYERELNDVMRRHQDLERERADLLRDIERAQRSIEFWQRERDENQRKKAEEEAEREKRRSKAAAAAAYAAGRQSQAVNKPAPHKQVKKSNFGKTILFVLIAFFALGIIGKNGDSKNTERLPKATATPKSSINATTPNVDVEKPSDSPTEVTAKPAEQSAMPEEATARPAEPSANTEKETASAAETNNSVAEPSENAGQTTVPDKEETAQGRVLYGNTSENRYMIDYIGLTVADIEDLYGSGYEAYFGIYFGTELVYEDGSCPYTFTYTPVDGNGYTASPQAADIVSAVGSSTNGAVIAGGAKIGMSRDEFENALGFPYKVGYDEREQMKKGISNIIAQGTNDDIPREYEIITNERDGCIVRAWITLPF